MSWLDAISEAGGELVDAVSDAGSTWIKGVAQNDIDNKQTASNPDEARPHQVEGQTADGRPLVSHQGGMNTTYIVMGVGALIVLLLVVMLMKGGK
ncbi:MULTISPECIES: hypothetical protein [Vibrio]|jgi:hypothetical protein|uniref:hypothetical protein n=1 Tax=Vibrio TaxID=662 RepID=UPI00018F3E55|nr:MULTISPECIES: hypothetical protein [Vibrio]EED25114.1 conserved hypothetical protein [Vibrio sp. 16]KHT41691.1 hypothetical protein RJ47_14035 [Vibrio sinaloensis]CAK4070781.1 hypothetical protein VDT1_2660 [Vibrio sp. 16]